MPTQPASFAFTPDAWRQHGDTLAALLARRAEDRGERPFIHLLGDRGERTTFSFAALHAGARAVAAGLQARGVRPGDRVLIVLPTGQAFLEIFFGLMLAGAVAVPVYPPLRAKGLAEYQARLSRLIAVASPRLIVGFRKVRLVVEAAAFDAHCAARYADGESLAGSPETFVPPAIDGESLALVQFSSGSTGDPRGVMLTHRNLLANVASVLAVIRPGPDDINCSWLPLYHDMGLIGGLLMPLFCGNPLVLMSPQGFLLDPKRWLRAIHDHRATISTAPNFAYQLIASRLDEQELAGLDLSCWRLALSGAEPVVPGTLEAFATRLGPYGFRAEALTPVYGLAEAALGAVFPPLGRKARLDRIDPEALSEQRVATPSAHVSAPAFPSVGCPLPGFDVRIAGESGEALPERCVGEVQLRGPSVMVGYLGDDEASRRAIAGEWLRTGDLGYMADGELFLVGRAKDLIVRAGRNYAPQDLEQAAESVAGIRKGCVAAFGVLDPAHGTERVVVVAESRETPDGHAALSQAVSQMIQSAVGLTPDQVVIAPPGAVPKTSSGKLRRGRCRELFLADQLIAPSEPGLFAMARVVGAAIAQRVVSVAQPAQKATHGQ